MLFGAKLFTVVLSIFYVNKLFSKTTSNLDDVVTAIRKVNDKFIVSYDENSVVVSLPEYTEYNNKDEELKKKYTDEMTKLREEFERCNNELNELNEQNDPDAVLRNRGKKKILEGKLKDFYQRMQNYENYHRGEVRANNEEYASKMNRAKKQKVSRACKLISDKLASGSKKPLVIAIPRDIFISSDTDYENMSDITNFIVQTEVNKTGKNNRKKNRRN